MHQITDEKVNKTAEEVESLVKKSKRKLLELEVMLSLSDIKDGEFDTFEDAKKLIKKVQE